MTRIMETSKTFILNDDNLAGAVHPGSILKDELRERKISQKEFAASIGMQASHLSALIHGVRNITADIAQRLEKALDILDLVKETETTLTDSESLISGKLILGTISSCGSSFCSQGISC